MFPHAGRRKSIPWKRLGTSKIIADLPLRMFLKAQNLSVSWDLRRIAPNMKHARRRFGPTRRYAASVPCGRYRRAIHSAAGVKAAMQSTVAMMRSRRSMARQITVNLDRIQLSKVNQVESSWWPQPQSNPHRPSEQFDSTICHNRPLQGAIRVPHSAVGPALPAPCQSCTHQTIFGLLHDLLSTTHGLGVTSTPTGA